MANYIDEAMTVNILQRLPVKSLLRCTAVSKSWYTLITSPHFISSHCKFSPPLVLTRLIKNSDLYQIYNLKYSFNLEATFSSPFKSMNSHFTIVGICNGLLCLSDDRVYYMNTIILWNPSIKTWVLLPQPSMIYNSYGSFTQCLAFGFDAAASDYKVLRVTYLDLASKPQIEVYRLSTDTWQDMSYSDLDSVILCNRSSNVYINGASHWLARSSSDSHVNLIVSFDMSREVFDKITLPVSGAPARSRDLVVCEDSLALVMWSEERWCVWMMREYKNEKSWTKNISLDLSNIDYDVMSRPLWFGGNNKVVIVNRDGRLFWCNHNGTEIGSIGKEDEEEEGEEWSRSSEEYKHALHVGGYTESLVLLEKRGRVHSM